MSRVLYGLIIPCLLYAALVVFVPAAYRSGYRQGFHAAKRETAIEQFTINETIRQLRAGSPPAGLHGDAR